MWHEARRRERATQKLFSDHKKRAEKRREENRVDPSTLLQVHGVKSKVNIDPNTHKLAANSMVVWQGDQKTTIDRFDVRTTLNSLPVGEKPFNRQQGINDNEKRRRPTILDASETEYMKKLLNFERYRLVMQNDLNKVQETSRLSLVNKRNEILSEAKMRKLKSNWFGTLGETSAPSSHTNNIRSSNVRSQGVSIGFDYNVLQLGDTIDDLPVQLNIASTAMIPDLDDCDAELDLDSVDKLQTNSENTNEVINRYGLNCDEFNVLVDSTSSSAKETILKLKQVKSEVKRRNEDDRLPEVANQQGFYGPVLPPDMHKKEDIHSSGNTSPIRQLSPSATYLPTRTRDKNQSPASSTDHGFVSQQTRDSTSTSARSKLDLPKRSETLEESSRNISSILMLSSSSRASPSPQQPSMNSEHNVVKLTTVANRLTPIQINLKNDKQADDKCSDSSIPDDTTHRARRAVTPLAYKRYSRSSRSLSRERIFSGRYRSRSNSTTSSSNTTLSQTPSSSMSDSSFDERSHSGSRRRIRSRSRSRSPGYRYLRRSRHKYHGRERR